ncbi:MAG: YhcG family protein [Lepagella sp.]
MDAIQGNIDNILFADIRQIIETTKSQVASSVNSAMTLMYWHIGDRIKREVLGGERAAYGKQIIARLAHNLQTEYGKGSFSEKHLRQMMRFAKVFPDSKIVYTVCRQLTWSHIRLLVPMEDQLQREFYASMAYDQRWSVRTLKAKIDGMLYERTAIAKKPEEVIEHDLEELRTERKMSPDLVFHDPYVLDFLGMHDNYSEKDLESAIVAELQRFITELGNDFAFLARQKRIIVDDEDYYIDLLFYHRRLRCLVAIDLKLGKFQAAYKGQMELYLRWLEKYDMAEGENKPIGLILCAGKNEEHIELLHLDDSNIRVADYLTKLPDRKVLEHKLQLAIERAHNRLNASKL